MARKRLTYKEGDWFAVPLRSGGFAVGVAARIDRRGGMIAYFFGPKRTVVPSIDELALVPTDAILVRHCGDLGLLEGTWPVVGSRSDWNRASWPIPAFGRVEPLGDRAWRVEYSEDDLNAPTRESRVSLDEAESLPKNGVLGAGAAERLLTHLLGEWPNA